MDGGGGSHGRIVARHKDDRTEYRAHTSSLTSVCQHNHHGIPPGVLDLLAAGLQPDRFTFSACAALNGKFETEL